MKFPSILLIILITNLIACSASNTPTETAILGNEASVEEMIEMSNSAGPIVFQKHLAARWSVPLSGLLNLDHPKAKAANLTDREEPIELYVYTIQHPTYGTFLIDSGVSSRFIRPGENTDIAWIVEKAMAISTLETFKTTQQLQQELGKIAGVFLTHIHIDHIMGVSDLTVDTPVYTGPGEASSKHLTHLFSKGTTDRLLQNRATLKELPFTDSGILDVFGDGSLWAIHSPGHTPGSTAFVVRAQNGNHLIVGDVTHTRWGWDNNVEPGSYSKDKVQNATSLSRLHKIAKSMPNIWVHPGHQQ